MLVLSRPATVLVLVIETTTGGKPTVSLKVDGIAKPTAASAAPVDYEHEHRFAEHEHEEHPVSRFVEQYHI